MIVGSFKQETERECIIPLPLSSPALRWGLCVGWMDACSLCKSSFSLMRRRHVCHRCQRSLCGECRGGKLSLTPGSRPQSVCNECYIVHCAYNKEEQLLMGVPARALRLFLRACAVDIRTCIEKRDLVEALLVWGSPDLPILQQVEKDVPNDDDDDENDDDESAKPVKSPTPTPETPTKGPSVPSTDHNTQFVNVSAGHQAYIATIEGCTIKKLKTLLHTRGISTDGCVEKSDLVARVVSHGIRITSPAEEDDGLCTICYERPGNIVLLYCGHIGFCETCATSLSECPYCRKPIARRQRVYRA